jgi:hypothetical protein
MKKEAKKHSGGSGKAVNSSRLDLIRAGFNI